MLHTKTVSLLLIIFTKNILIFYIELELLYS